MESYANAPGWKAHATELDRAWKQFDDRQLAKKPIAEWDVAALLKLMWEAWNELFGKTLRLETRAPHHS